ncbi:carbamoyltransferase HypF [Microbulbifer rhizosphaerae]|uniref:Carbamoyltransferase HypF n=1 Tax=Microbulbifer rhizosphaerae TaxID=1562603 RepID=A0A7W4WGU6_9GAMM|nr:carbamoyltransferase HypF [Microbulbifer rhizosphaerae]MBB3063428.1 hydrogenase maturation protein HypF [Microbulbifer rhizosphaerae]
MDSYAPQQKKTPQASSLEPRIAESIRVRGLVQGVGLRPLVWRLAGKYGLSGSVGNDAEGVWIHVSGVAGQVDRLVEALRSAPPPLARIDSIERLPRAPVGPAESGFHIAASLPGEMHTQVAADAATCADCLGELFAPDGRRRGFAFTNCTHCGPRISIVRSVPYDRINTSMGAFAQCPACLEEYRNPADRRFHAQPNCCPDCGPHLWLEWAEGHDHGPEADPIARAQESLRAGKILLLKGVGGFHLACNATDPDAVTRLRTRKRRPHKPFALLARDLEMIRRYCSLSDTGCELLQHRAAPILLLPQTGAAALAPGVAPGQRCYGFMLPPAPLHHLLMAGLEFPLVCTSGNRSGEPQCIANDDARALLGAVADAALLYDRDIVNRLDDSVVREIDGRPAILRRARGYVPEPLMLPETFAAAPPLLALGGELKNTFCLLKDGQAVLSQHIGDLHNRAVGDAFEQSLQFYRELFDHAPRAIAVDAHPEYRSGKIGRALAARESLRLEVVQHHHAHIAACLADNGVPLDAEPVLGIALDGLGYGTDGSFWGGEFLLADYRNSERLASFEPVPIPGGERAIRQPWRMAFAWLHQVFGNDLSTRQRLPGEFGDFLARQPLETLARMIDTGFNSPLTSSCGRLFDAVAAVIGLCREISFEGQAAMALEACVDSAALAGGGNGYPFEIGERGGLSRLCAQPMWRALLEDLRRGTAAGVVAARFHLGLAEAIGRMVDRLGDRCGAGWSGRVALSGGVFQNAVLSSLLVRQLRRRGLEVLCHRRVPANDGGLSLGQAAVAAARLLQSRGAGTCA